MTVAEQQRSLGTETFFDKLLDDAITVPDEPLDLRDYVTLALNGGFPRPALGLRTERRADKLVRQLHPRPAHS